VLSLSWRVVLAGLAMGGVLFPLRDLHGPLVVGVVALGAIVYGMALLLLGTFDAEEIAMARRAVGR